MLQIIFLRKRKLSIKNASVKIFTFPLLAAKNYTWCVSSTGQRFVFFFPRFRIADSSVYEVCSDLFLASFKKKCLNQ